MRTTQSGNHRFLICSMLALAAGCTTSSAPQNRTETVETRTAEPSKPTAATAGSTPAPGTTLSTDPARRATGLSWRWDPKSGGDCRAVEPATGGAEAETARKTAHAEQPSDGGASRRTGPEEGGMSLNGYTPECLQLAGMSWTRAWRDLAYRRLVELATLSLDQLPPVCTQGGETLLSYLVTCALDAGQEITVTCADGPRRFPGKLGLVPAWHDKKLVAIAHGRERVTACLMAHANHDGATVPIWLRATFMQQPSRLPRDVVQEGAFAGNLFPDAANPLALYGFRSPALTSVPSTSPGRVCTLSQDTCGFDVAHTSCSRSTGTPYYDRCVNGSTQTVEVITTYLRRDTLTPVPVDRSSSIEPLTP